jgi:hypothetical protein
MLCHVVSVEIDQHFIGHHTDNGSSKHLCNVSQFVQDHMVQHLRSHSSSPSICLKCVRNIVKTHIHYSRPPGLDFNLKPPKHEAWDK